MFCFSKCCRLCLKQNETLFDYKLCDNNEFSFIQNIINISSELIEDSYDDYPKLICSECQTQLHSTYKFLENCFKSQQFLKNYKLKFNSTDDNKLKKVYNLEISLFKLTEQMIKDISRKEEFNINREEVNINREEVEEEYNFNRVEVKEEYNINPEKGANFLNNDENKMLDNFSIDIVKHELDPLNIKEEPNDDFALPASDNNDESHETTINLTKHALSNEEPKLPYTNKSLVDLQKEVASEKIHSSNNLIIQTVKRRYSCDICDKKFNKQTNLADHKNIHTGEHPYSCEICNKKFIKRLKLIRHVRTHSGEKPYSCEICNKNFIQHSHLVSHRRTHTGERPYSCDICNKTYIYSSHLVDHKRTHTGERPYSCDICNKKFIQNSDLFYHLRTHTGEKPYSCEICNKTFIKKSKLDKHIRIHNRKK